MRKLQAMYSHMPTWYVALLQRSVPVTEHVLILEGDLLDIDRGVNYRPTNEVNSTMPQIERYNAARAKYHSIGSFASLSDKVCAMIVATVACPKWVVRSLELLFTALPFACICFGTQIPPVVPRDAPDLPPMTHWRWLNSYRSGKVSCVIFFILINVLPPLLLLIAIAMLAVRL